MKILLIGSGLSARNVQSWNIKNHVVATLNHAWKIYPDFHIAFYAGDLPEEDIPVSEHRDRIFVSDLVGPLRNQYTFNSCRHFLKTGNLTTLIMTLTWMLWYSKEVSLKVSRIGFIGCDLNYEPDENGFTHFYGMGKDVIYGGLPDPFRERTRHEIVAQLLSLEKTAKSQNINLINYSDDPKSLLPFPKEAFND